MGDIIRLPFALLSPVLSGCATNVPSSVTKNHQHNQPMVIMCPDGSGSPSGSCRWKSVHNADPGRSIALNGTRTLFFDSGADPRWPYHFMTNVSPVWFAGVRFPSWFLSRYVQHGRHSIPCILQCYIHPFRAQNGSELCSWFAYPVFFR